MFNKKIRTWITQRVLSAYKANGKNIVTSLPQRPGVADSDGGAPWVVRTVVGWSYTQLPDEQAHLFRRLGLHPGAEFGVHAAAVLAELDLATADRRLEALADMHLIERVGDKRYRFHDLLHAYAAHRADVDDTADGRHRARTAVLTWYAHTARTADKPLFPGLPCLEVELDPVVHDIVLDDREQALEWLNREQANLMAALRTAVQHRLYDVALVLATTARFLILRERTLWTVRGEAETLGLTAAQASHNRAAEAFLLGFRGETLTDLDKLNEAEVDFTAQLALARELHDPIHERFGLGGLGRVRLEQKRYPEAEQYYQQALPLARRAGDRRPEAVVECNLSQINAHQGRYEQALVHAERELALRRRAGDRVGEAYALWDEAVARQGLGEHAAAIELTDRAMEMYRTLAGTEKLRALVLETAAISFEQIGDVTLAAKRLTEACVLLEEIDAPRADALRDRAHTLTTPAADPDIA